MDSLPMRDIMERVADQRLAKGIVSPVLRVKAAYEALKEKPKLLAAEKRLLFECCLIIEEHDFSGWSSDAASTRQALEARNKTFKFRPPKKKRKAKS